MTSLKEYSMYWLNNLFLLFKIIYDYIIINSYINNPFKSYLHI